MASNSEIAQKSFNPSWMQAASPLKMPKSNGVHRAFNNDDDSASMEMMQPIFSKHRYGREDILALIPNESKAPPDGLEQCPYFIEKPQPPIILTSLSETEQRLQQNINSSKALSAAHRNEWQSKDGSELPGSNSPQTNNSWMIAGSSRSGPAYRPTGHRWAASNNEGGRGAKSYSGFGRPGFGSNAGSNTSDKSRLVKGAWSESGSGFKPRQHLKSTNEELVTRTDEKEQAKVPASDTWNGAWRSAEGKANDRQKSAELSKPFSRIVNNENLENEPKDIIWSSSTLHNDPVWSSPSIKEISNETEKLETFAHSAPNSEQQKQVETDFGAQRSKISPPQSSDSNEFMKSDQWFYLDPQSVQRGPFTTEQMQAWFVNGYFHAELQIMSPENTTYTPLGSLIKQNGALTPFVISKVKHDPISSSSDAATFSAPSSSWPQPAASAIIQKPTQETLKNNFGNSGNDLSLDTLKLLEVRERMIAEEQRKLLEKEEALRREEREREEKNAKLLEMQMKLEQQRQEIEQRALEQEKQLELHRLQILEYERQQREKLEKLEQERKLRIQQEDLSRRRQSELELAKKEQERQLLLMQAEMKQKEEKRRQELLEFQRQQEIRVREEAERAVAKRAAAAEQRLREQQAQHLVELERQRLLVQEQQAQQKIASAKIAPWHPAVHRPQKTTEFREIQEQERIESLRRQQMEEEKRRELEVARGVKSTQGNGNPWNVIKSSAKPAAIPPAKEQQQQQQSSQPKQPANPKPQPAKETRNEDLLTAWVVQRIRQMSTNIDPDVFASFLQGIESPDEVEDYIITYFGETKRAKEFHQEFLAKRIELRPRRGGKKEDDLSGPAVAAVANSIPSTKTGGKKSKKGKKVDISAAMSFRPVGDASRFNAGEIDLDISAAPKKGKKK